MCGPLIIFIWASFQQFLPSPSISLLFAWQYGFRKFIFQSHSSSETPIVPIATERGSTRCTTSLEFVHIGNNYPSSSGRTSTSRQFQPPSSSTSMRTLNHISTTGLENESSFYNSSSYFTESDFSILSPTSLAASSPHSVFDDVVSSIISLITYNISKLIIILFNSGKLYDF